MKVTFKGAVVSDFRDGTSKSGNAYGVVTFLDSDFRQYQVFLFGDDIENYRSLPMRTALDLSFELLPGRDGGVRLVGVRS